MAYVYNDSTLERLAAKSPEDLVAMIKGGSVDDIDLLLLLNRVRKIGYTAGFDEGYNDGYAEGVAEMESV